MALTLIFDWTANSGSILFSFFYIFPQLPRGYTHSSSFSLLFLHLLLPRRKIEEKPREQAAHTDESIYVRMRITYFPGMGLGVPVFLPPLCIDCVCTFFQLLSFLTGSVLESYAFPPKNSTNWERENVSFCFFILSLSPAHPFPLLSSSHNNTPSVHKSEVYKTHK